MATIYVIDSLTNPGTLIKYRSAAWPDAGNGTDGSTLNAASTAAGAAGTVVIEAGTFTNTQLHAGGMFSTAAANQLIRAAIAADGGSHEGTVIIAGGGVNYAIQNGQAGVIWQKLTITNTGTDYYAVYMRDSGTLNDCYITAVKNAIGHNCAAPSITTLNRCSIVGGGSKLFVASNTNSALVANYSLFDFANLSGSVLAYSNAATLNNSIMINSYGNVWEPDTNNTKTITLNNSIISGNSLSANNKHIINNVQANMTMAANNCLMLPNPWDPDDYNFVGITLTDCIETEVPGFLSPKYPGVMVFCIDDTGARNAGYLADVKALAEQYGFKIVWAMNQTATAVAADWAAAIDLVADGHEVSCHTRHHWPLATLTTFSVAKAGVSITIAANVLTPTAGDPIDLTAYTLASLKAKLAAAPYSWTIAGTDPGTSTVPATVLADVAGQSINAAYTLTLNEAKLFYENIDTSISDIQTNMPGYTVTSFTPPGNSTSANLRTYLSGGVVGGATISQAFVGARGNPTLPSNHLNSINIYNLMITDSSIHGVTTKWELAGGTRTDGIKRNTAALCEGLNGVGGVIVLYFHSDTEYSLTDLAAVFDVVKKSNVQVMTLTQAINYAKTYDPSGDVASADGITYTRTLVDGSDYRLRADSACKNAGLNTVWATQPSITDLAGYPITNAAGAITAFGGTVDIGAYEWVGVSGLSPGLGLSGGNRPPWWNRRR